jgi:hypothetical protein
VGFIASQIKDHYRVLTAAGASELWISPNNFYPWATVKEDKEDNELPVTSSF